MFLPNSLPGKARVIEISTPGGAEVLKPAMRAVPVPRGRDIVIEVCAAGVNRPDVYQRMGQYDPPPGASDLPGLEAAGIVAAIGDAVTRWKVGDAVAALLPGGGYAEYALTHEDHALPVPPGMSMVEAGALCETFFTVWSNLFMRGRLEAGEDVLVHGGTSGIGTTAIMLAAAKGARVFATAGSPAKCAKCVALGAAHAINYHEEDFVEVVKRETGGRGVQAVLDIVGGDYIPRNIKALATDGRLLQIAFLSGGRSATINFAEIMSRRLLITGSTLRPQSDERKGQIARALEADVWPLLADGKIRPVIDTVLPLDQAADAHRRMESSQHIGKIVLEVRPSPIATTSR